MIYLCIIEWELFTDGYNIHFVLVFRQIDLLEIHNIQMAEPTSINTRFKKNVIKNTGVRKRTTTTRLKLNNVTERTKPACKLISNEIWNIQRQIQQLVTIRLPRTKFNTSRNSSQKQREPYRIRKIRVRPKRRKNLRKSNVSKIYKSETCS